ncbi:MAG TPA: M20/M25/M40 family metallo-hydrolase, partial [Sphingomonas sp.]
MPNVVELTRALIAAESVTPATGEVFDVLAQALSVIGFEIDRFTVGEEPDGPVENMIAIRHGKGPHFAFAGHLDVVPPGDGWASGAFAPEVRGDLLYGRGAVDMKGAIAAFAVAAAQVEGPTISLLITGDEEG